MTLSVWEFPLPLLYLLFGLLIAVIIGQHFQLKRYEPGVFCPNCGNALSRFKRCRRCEGRKR